jgi:hypothetical protein
MKILKNKSRITKIGLTSVSVTGLLIAGGAAASAATANTTINASIQKVISVSSAGPVNLSITPAAGGSVTSGSDTITVGTNGAAGYTLTFADSDATTSLTNGGNNITAGSGSQTTPANLANNTWGYRVDGVGGFTGTTTAESSASGAGAFQWAGVPATGSPNTIKTTASMSVSDTTKIWYAARVDQTIPSGSYSDTVTYTATAN